MGRLKITKLIYGSQNNEKQSQKCCKYNKTMLFFRRGEASYVYVS